VLSAQHRRFLLRDQLVGSSLVNFPLNAAIAWLAFGSAAAVPLWGTSSIAADTLGTAIILPILTSLIVSRLVLREVRRGRLAPLPAPAVFASPWPRRSSLACGALVGAAAIVVAALPVIAVFALAGPAELQTPSFIWFKAAFAAALGALVTPLLAWWALGRASMQRLSPAASP
jgi:hypothetical protein